jgi:UDP-2-acetamido-3-amino-2,3-dideoxy-glucuronate N-acetyltransferase
MTEQPHPMFNEHRAETAVIHESSFVDVPCRIGQYTRVQPFSHIMSHSIIGDHCHIGHHVIVASGVVIGNHVNIQQNSVLNPGVILEDDVFCGPSTVFSTLNRMRHTRHALSPVSPTLVRRGTNIGANSTIASGFTIGCYTFIEAGSVIDSHIPDFALVSGNPAHITGWVCLCGERLHFEDDSTRCAHCGKHYQHVAKHRIVLCHDEAARSDSNPQPYPPIPRAQNAD